MRRPRRVRGGVFHCAPRGRASRRDAAPAAACGRSPRSEACGFRLGSRPHSAQLPRRHRPAGRAGGVESWWGSFSRSTSFEVDRRVYRWRADRPRGASWRGVLALLGFQREQRDLIRTVGKRRFGHAPLARSLYGFTPRGIRREIGTRAEAIRRIAKEVDQHPSLTHHPRSGDGGRTRRGARDAVPTAVERAGGHAALRFPNHRGNGRLL